MPTHLLLQKALGPDFTLVCDALESAGNTLVFADDDELIPALSEHGNALSGVVLFEINGASSRLCRLIRNSRFSHPWTPIALVCKPHRSLPTPVGSRFFNDDELDELSQYVSHPHQVEVVVIEDDEGIREYLDLCLSKFYTVQAFADGESGLEYLNSNNCDLVILDVMLPGISGGDVMRELQSRSFDTPVIIITAYDNPQREASFVAQGASDYLKKPFANSDYIRDTVMRVLNDTHERNVRAGKGGEQLLQEKAWIDYANTMKRYLD